LVVALVLAVYSVVDVLQSERRVLGRLGRLGWLAVVLLVPVLGPLVWILSARSRAAAAGPAPSAGAAPPRRVLAPEDDPDFLRQLRESDNKHERMLEQWEEDLRRRERGLRGDGSSEPPQDPPAKG
jgi:hypothetical protein